MTGCHWNVIIKRAARHPIFRCGREKGTRREPEPRPGTRKEREGEAARAEEKGLGRGRGRWRAHAREQPSKTGGEKIKRGDIKR